MGGMIWGIGSALHEATKIDSNVVRYVNTNLVDDLVPANADAILVPEGDKLVNPLGVKGVGEIVTRLRSDRCAGTTGGNNGFTLPDLWR